MILGLSSPTYMGGFLPEKDTLSWLLDRCAEYDLHALEAGLPPDGSEDPTEVRRKAADLDVEWVAFWSSDFVDPQGGVAGLRELAARAFNVAKAGGCRKLVIHGNGAKHNRFVRKPSLDEQLSKLAVNLAGVAEEAAERGLVLGLLPHLDYRSHEVLSVVEDVGHPALRIAVDCANALPVSEEPVHAVRALAEHAITVAFKDVRVYPYRSNNVTIWGTPIGQGSVDYETILPILKSRLPDPANTTGCIKVRLPPDNADHDSWLRQSIDFLKGKV